MADIFLDTLAHGALFVFIYMTLWYVVATVAKRSDLIDVAWGLGFILLTMLILVSYENASFRPILVSLLVFVWGLRLSMSVFWRNSGRGESSRYRKLREEWGKYFFLRSYLKIFMFRGVLLLLVAVPVVYINTFGGGELEFLDFLGAGLWLLGFLFEAASDRQLSKFLRVPENKGKAMEGGLWLIFSHPNYLGEAAEWWGIFLMALPLPYGYLTIVGPLAITLVILKNSRNTATEEIFEI
ncbi:MAG: hypothetical protein LiPW15_609 [Parcubacteria group bacterium LiPW_15]|nr:MAG: hypothetical protein LiPW15_609 [Parcubacteria group bacterium LiPW_15]